MVVVLRKYVFGFFNKIVLLLIEHKEEAVLLMDRSKLWFTEDLDMMMTEVLRNLLTNLVSIYCLFLTSLDWDGKGLRQWVTHKILILDEGRNKINRF
jgi:hypothetical protein